MGGMDMDALTDLGVGARVGTPPPLVEMTHDGQCKTQTLSTTDLN